jgi:glycosyltransferase involved in cell wall biosynthesis
MRVLILHSRYLSGAASGENRVAEDEAALLAAAGHEVTLWSPEPEVGGAVRLARTAAGTIWSPAAVRAVRRRIRERAVDVVHVHNLFPSLSPAVLRGAAAEGAAVVMTLHNYRLMCLPATFLRDGRVCEDCLDHAPWRGVQHRCYRGSAAGSATLAASLTIHRRIGTFGDVHRYVAVSGFVRDKYVEAGFPADRVVVKPNFSDAAEPRTGAGEYFLYLGRLSHEKGVDTLLRAWGAAPPGRRLLIVGDGPDGAALRRDAPPGVDFAGQVLGDEVPAILRRARALLVPSRWYEAAPRGITEAYAAGVPVIATRIGALEEAVDDDVTGALAPLDDASGWTAAVERLSDDALSERLGAGALERWRERYSPERGLAGLEAAYREALDARNG